jgi:hypothetical protein
VTDVKPATGNARSARIVAVFGATGTGKSIWTIQQLKKPKRNRLVIWSPKEAQDCHAGTFSAQAFTSVSDAYRIMSAAGSTSPFRLVFVPSMTRKTAIKQFDAICAAALKLGNITLVVEELHTVTQPSWAPDQWSALVLMGRAAGVEIFALSQRPASVDKDLFSNVSMIHAGRVSFEDDAKTLGRVLLVPPGELLTLPDLHYIERTTSPNETRRGVVKP